MNNKYKKIPLVLMGLAGVALLTSGFSTWVISTQATITQENITISAGSVNDQRLAAKIVADNESGLSVSFDADGTSGTYIKSSGTAGEGEDLTFGAKIQIGLAKNLSSGEWKKPTDEGFTFATASTLFDKLKFNFIAQNTSSEDKYTKYLTQDTPAVDSGVNNSIFGFNLYNKSGNNFVGEDLEISVSSLDSTTRDPLKTSWSGTPAQQKSWLKLSDLTSSGHEINYIEYTFRFSFGWGSYFGYENPTHISEESKVAGAVTRLQGLKDDVNNLKFKVTVSTDKTASAS